MEKSWREKRIKKCGRHTKGNARYKRLAAEEKNTSNIFSTKAIISHKCTSTCESLHRQRHKHIILFSMLLLSSHRFIHVKPLMFDGNEQNKERQLKKSRYNAELNNKKKDEKRKKKKKPAGWLGSRKWQRKKKQVAVCIQNLVYFITVFGFSHLMYTVFIFNSWCTLQMPAKHSRQKWVSNRDFRLFDFALNFS